MGQIKNIKLHIVTDIKTVVVSKLILSKPIMVAPAPVAVNNILRAARYLAVIGGVVTAQLSMPFQLVYQQMWTEEMQAHADAEAAAAAAKKVADDAAPSILE